MKLITLWQPWASLMAAGVKTIETRGWSTDYRGPLVIHAAKTWNEDCREAIWGEEFWRALRHIYDWPDRPLGRLQTARWRLPFGNIVGVCNLIDCLPIEYCGDCDGCGWAEGGEAIRTACKTCAGGGAVPRGVPLTKAERAFGNYEVGRYGFVISMPRRLRSPIPYKSRLGKLLPVDAVYQRFMEKAEYA